MLLKARLSSSVLVPVSSFRRRRCRCELSSWACSCAHTQSRFVLATPCNQPLPQPLPLPERFSSPPDLRFRFCQPADALWEFSVSFVDFSIRKYMRKKRQSQAVAERECGARHILFFQLTDPRAHWRLRLASSFLLFSEQRSSAATKTDSETESETTRTPQQG